MVASPLLHFNGINGATGEYELPPMTVEELARTLRGQPKANNLDDLRIRVDQIKMGKEDHFGVKAGVDPTKLEETGWGVIFAQDANPAIGEALKPLLDLRKKQAGARFRLYCGVNGHQPDEGKSDFLARHGAGPGPADPDKVPYYLLIVGDPERIPYTFQYQLDVQYAVGRIDFDTIEEYDNYARSVVAAETGQILLPREIALFGVANPDDPATQASAEYLLKPIAQHIKNLESWQLDSFLREDANKDQLGQLLGGDKTPALLFSASHGMAFPSDDPRQCRHQGALLCQDWPGPNNWQGHIPQDHYFAADDLASDASLAGLIAFNFACYGAGTPHLDDFAKYQSGERRTIAPHAFLSQLPRRMLSHPRGGALAAIGHVDRAWGYSFLWDDAGAQTTVFTSTLEKLLEGYPVGAALEFFNERYAELSTELTTFLSNAPNPSSKKVAKLWTANNDARSYIIIGDPAVRMPVAKAGAAGQSRPVLQLKTIPEPPCAGESNTTQPHQESVMSENQQVPMPYPQDIDYGLRDTVTSIKDALSKTLTDLSSLEIRTYTCDSLDDIGEYDSKTKSFSGETRLQAYTRISMDGDSVTVVPQHPGTDREEPAAPAINERLWEIHNTNVQQALENRQAFIKNLLEAPGSLMRGLVK